MAEASADLGGFLEAAGRSLVDAQGSLARAWQSMDQAGVQRISGAALEP